HMAAALSFQENAVDAVAVKNMGQEQTGRAAADDRHLGSLRRRCHCRLSKKGCWLSKGSTAETRKSILQARVGKYAASVPGQSRRIETLAIRMACPLCSNSDPIGASQRSVAMCQQQTHAPQQTPMASALFQVDVPYRTGAPRLTDLLAGQVPIMFDNLPTPLEHIRGD